MGGEGEQARVGLDESEKRMLLTNSNSLQTPKAINAKCARSLHGFGRAVCVLALLGAIQAQLQVQGRKKRAIPTTVIRGICPFGFRIKKDPP